MLTISSSSTRSCLRHFRETLCSLASCKVSLRTVVLRQMTTSTLQARKRLFTHVPLVLDHHIWETEPKEPKTTQSPSASVFTCSLGTALCRVIGSWNLNLMLSHWSLDYQTEDIQDPTTPLPSKTSALKLCEYFRKALLNLRDRRRSIPTQHCKQSFRIMARTFIS